MARPASPFHWSLATGLAVVGLLAVATSVSAHSDLVGSTPADGGTVAFAPAEVVLRFDNPVEPSATQVRLQDENGTRLESTGPEHADGLRTVRIGLPAGLGNGTYVVRWSILSEDGHPNAGRVTFAVGSNATLPPPDATESELPSVASVAGRVLSYAGLALALGAAAWLWLVRAGLDGMERPAGQALAAGALLHAAGAAVLFGATLQATGASAAALAASDTGRLLVVRIATALAAFVGAAFPAGRWRGGAVPRILGVGLMLAAAVATSAIGHAASLGVPGLLADAMHLVSSVTWVGGLVLLLVALGLARRQELGLDAVRRIGLRFGTLALACVIVLVLSGTSSALVILGRTALTDPLHLVDSLYGRLLLAKVALAMLMVGVAAVNRFVFLSPPPAAPTGLRARVARLGPDGTASSLRRTVAVELAIGIAVLAVAGALTAVSPGDHDAHAGHAADEHAGHAVTTAPAATASPSGETAETGGTATRLVDNAALEWPRHAP